MIGLDEVGRGAWAGPLLVVAARQTGEFPVNLTDSKLLKKADRQKMITKLQKSCNFGEGWVAVTEIDQFGLAQAMRLGVARALSNLRASYQDEIVIDGAVNYVDALYKNARAQIKADLLIPVVSAASVYAKVLRDQYMTKLGERYPMYGFSEHVGYGTKAHSAALLDFGLLTGIHRLGFKPINSLAGAMG